MGENSIFNKINEIKNEKLESKKLDKEQIYQDVRAEIEELKQKKQQYLNLYEKINSKKEEFSTNHEIYHKALEEALAIFENEEAKAILAEQGVEGVKGLLSKHADTDEAKNLNASESLVKENIENLKKMKAEIIEMFNIKNPDYKSLRGVISAISHRADAIDGEIFDNSIDTPEGRESWPLYYPTGMFHKETNLEKDIKENKTPKLRGIYHDLGDRIDSAFLEAIKEYKPVNPNDAVLMDADYKEGRHIISRKPIGVEDNKITFHFGGGYSSLKYEIVQNNQGQLFFSRKDDYKALLSRDFLKIFNKKLHQIDENFKSIAESI